MIDRNGVALMAGRTPRLLVVALAIQLAWLPASCADSDGQREGVDDQPNPPQQQGGAGEPESRSQARLVVVEETTRIQQQESAGEQTTDSQHQGSAGEVPDHELTACGSGDGLHEAALGREIDGKIAFAGQIYASTSASPNVSSSVGSGEDVTVEPVGSAGPDVVYGHSDLCVIDGTGLARLTNTPEDEISPIWSPDGEKIAFLGAPDGVNVINDDGSGLANIPWSDSAMPAAGYVFSRGWAWSPDGRTFAYASGCGLYTTPADAPGTFRAFEIYRPDRRVASASPDQICPESPAWSPNGEQIAFTDVAEGGAGELYVIDVSPMGRDRDLWKLTDDPATSASWSPDGSEIAFVRVGSSSTKIYKIDLGSLKETPLADGAWPTWSPDGNKIAFVGDGGAIHVMDSGGSNPTPIFDAAGVQISQPVWQPLP